MGQQAKISLPQAIFNGFLRVTVKVLNSYSVFNIFIIPEFFQFYKNRITPRTTNAIIPMIPAATCIRPSADVTV